MFKEVPSKFDFPKTEQEVAAFWEANKIYEKSLQQREGCEPFIFFEGPPTANGLPHPGHCLTRAMKDLFPRYKTMTGHYCLRKGGWDTHGLPVEVEVCKELGIHSKEEIEAYGVEPFNRKCLESVFRYTKEWEDLTRRIGFWVNLDEAYVTYHQSYIESVWWALKTFFDAGLLYQGHKIVWWWAQGGTALSAGEVKQGYREVADPSVFVRFPLVKDERFSKLFSRDPQGSAGREDAEISLLVWTTTPWTLPSNMFAAVHADFEYALVRDEEDGERLIFAKELVEPIAKKLKATKRWKIERTFKGSELVGLRYKPPFPEVYYDVLPGTRAELRGVGEDWDPLSGVFALPTGDITWGDQEAELVEGGKRHLAWRVVHAEFVTLDAGTGLVHEAPAFGEVDFDLLKRERAEFKPTTGGLSRLPLFCAVQPNGGFRKDAGDKYFGRWVKDCDKDLCRDMKDRKILVFQEQYRHDYPFCWRAEEDPLIQYPRRGWFIRTTQFKEDMLANNQHIHWLPEHIKAGRFGKFLESNVDWSLSRERYWGTPLPIWVCQDETCGHTEAIDAYDALVSKPGVQGLEVWEKAKVEDPDITEDLKVHKPYIDAITYECPKCDGGRMRRVPEVIDCWFDAGAMPFAQWGYPHRNVEMFKSQFPAHFISEALDQTRGWFYSLTAISVLLFGENGVARSAAAKSDGLDACGSVPDWPMPFETCIVLGLLMGEDGQKMSKSKKNYKEPGYIFEHEGADAMRWLFLSGQTPWTSIRFQEAAIAESQREFLIRLYNCYSFFVIYANIDGWTPDQRAGEEAKSELDRWILSALNQCFVDVHERMEAYDNYNAAKVLVGFVDALSNWYVRRNRERFWRSGMDADKRAAYGTLYDCLVAVSKLIAPFTPFIAESMYQNLVRAHDSVAPLSVHLCDYPITEANRDEIRQRIDHTLNEHIETVRRIVSCGRAARAQAKIRVRQPLRCVEIILAETAQVDATWLGGDYSTLIQDELNVKQVRFAANPEDYVDYQIKPNFRSIGPKHGGMVPAIKKALAAATDAARMRRELETHGETRILVDGDSIELTSDDVQIELAAKPGWTAAQDRTAVVVLETEITDDLRDEGIARDLVNQIQQARKNLDLRYEQRIDLAIVGDEDIQRVISGFGKYIMGETLAQTIMNRPIPSAERVTAKLGDMEAEIHIKPLDS